ncbi:hypothetical protein GWM34_00158, partial [Candida africana]
MNKQLKEFQEYLPKCRKIIALVGAGLSSSSGLPTFRGSQGLWKNFNMIDLATPDAFYIDPGLVWHKLSHKFNSDEYITITQNVDGLLSRSGHNLDSLYEIHGSLFDLKCTSFMCNYVDHNNFKQPLTKALEDTEFEYSNLSTRKRTFGDSDSNDGVDISLSPQFNPVKTILEKDLPSCPVCHDLLRPGVVWFGESLPLNLITEIDSFVELDPSVDLILVIGTSGTVYPANSYVERVRLKGGKVAIFNTDIEDNILNGKVEDTWGFKGDAAELLPIALKPLIGDI